MTDKQLGKAKEWGDKGLLSHSGSHCTGDSRQPCSTAWETKMASVTGWKL